MKKSINLAISLCILFNAGEVLASTPIPTFDKEAVTTHPYNRTGQQDVISDKTNLKELYQPGNTGTETKPAFYVNSIELTGYKIPDEEGKLAQILAKYSSRSIDIEELNNLTAEITEYCRDCGYTIPQAIIPAQEVKDGVLQIKVYISTYDKITIDKNTSKVADRVLNKFIAPLKSGEVITDKKFEITMNNLNDLPGVTAKAIFSPGSKISSTNVSINIERRPIWNNYIFMDNGGGYYSGKYRYGFNTEINNPSHQGDKFIINGSLTSHDVRDYGIRYETPVGSRGTRMGIGYSQSSYEISTNDMYDSIGRSRGISIYGLTPIYRDRLNRVTAIYGFDRRKIKDDINLKQYHQRLTVADKTANVWHVGISGSQYYPNQFLQYNTIYWYGGIHTDGGAYYDGHYHKLTGDLLRIWYDNKFNYRITGSYQLANRALDSSEQFYLGGIDGVRAYGTSDGFGDYGYLLSGEIRMKTDVKGLETALFIDIGGAKNKANKSWDHLSGWGIGLRYEKENDWYAQLDYAWKINGRTDRVEPENHDGRLWFQIYNMF